MSAGRLPDPGMSDGTSLLGARAADWAAECSLLKSRANEYGPHFPRSQPDGPRKDQQLLGTQGIWSPPPPSGAPASIGDKAGTPSHADGALGQRMV